MKNEKDDGARTLSGEAIFLRPITREDTPLIVKWRNNPRVRQNFVYRKTFTEETHAAWLRESVETGGTVQFIICERASAERPAGRPVGSVFFRDIDRRKKSAEYGIFIGEDDAVGRGYGNETAVIACAYAFHTMGLERIILRVFRDNLPAIRSYEHAGFRRRKLLPEVLCSDGTRGDMWLMELSAHGE